MERMKLGIFDSGIGGEAVAASLRLAFPQATILTVNDKVHVPYGNKSAETIVSLTDAAIQPLLRAGCDSIVLACNTATAAAIEILRARYPEQKFIGLEPMVKTAAALTKSKIVAICATPATLSSERYRHLVSKFGTNLKILEPDCSDWASMIEHNQVEHDKIATIINDLCKQGADVIVLGCTHYHWIKELITSVAENRAKVIDPSDAIARRVEHLLS